MNNLLTIILLTWSVNCLANSNYLLPDTPSNGEFKPGGDATLKRLKTRTFMEPIQNIPRIEQLQFWEGFSFFRDPWIAAPAVTRARDGLGPLFNARSCKSCHVRGGRGHLSKNGNKANQSLLFRFLKHDISQGDSKYGTQLHPIAVRLSHPKITSKIKAEGNVIVHYEPVKGTYDDGTEYTLRKPVYNLNSLAYGKKDDDSYISARYSPALYGMGLLDAIDEQALLFQEDIFDKNQDGISAKYNRVTNYKTGDKQIGRFGFKGLHPTLEQQVAGAFLHDIGITNPIFQKETCLAHQTACLQAAGIAEKGVLDAQSLAFDVTVYMSQLIAVQPARDLTSQKSLAGRALFNKLKCGTCHTPKYITRVDYPIKALSKQQIWPYTDLALHDMGPSLADKGKENLATGSEWRTPPLWGIGLQKKIQGFEAYLHDGRARTIEEAILWHGGEAKPQQQQFISLTKDERKALLHFIKQI